MNAKEVLKELESLGNERTKKIYISQGAIEPLFGVTIKSMKPLFKKIKINHALAEDLYKTGNYDAMYLGGMIADPKAMTAEDFDRWMEKAYFHMISDYIVAVTLSESDIAQSVADKWIEREDELYKSAGYSCYCWLLGNRKDEEFDSEKISKMLDDVAKSIHSSPDRAKYAMNYFVITVGISYIPLHDKALEVAKSIGEVEVLRNGKKVNVQNAATEIEKAKEKGRLGFKRKYVRC